MSQLTIYLDETAMREVRKAARSRKLSVSRWARENLTLAARGGWPDGYFSVFGALKDSDLARPPQGDLASDSPRQEL